MGSKFEELSFAGEKGIYQFCGQSLTTAGGVAGTEDHTVIFTWEGYEGPGPREFYLGIHGERRANRWLDRATRHPVPRPGGRSGARLE